MTNSLTVLDYSAVAIYLVLMAGIGIIMGRYVKNVKEYFSGGNAVPWHLGAISNYMTMISAFVFVAHAGVVYQNGLIGLLLLWSPVPATVFATLFLAHRWRRAGLTTPVEYLEQRYGSSVRQIVSWCGIGFRILENMVRLYALGIVVSGTLGCSLELAAAVCGGIAVVYTMIGGLWAVVVTDAVQCAILLMITAVIRVNAIAPGFFINKRNSKILTTPEGGLTSRGKNVMAHTPLGRFGEADELLGCVRWLLDDRVAGFVTGITMPVDGGFLAASGV